VHRREGPFDRTGDLVEVVEREVDPIQLGTVEPGVNPAASIVD
jgi:hypothetical protein